MSSWEPDKIDFDIYGPGDEEYEWSDDLIKDLEIRFNKLRQFRDRPLFFIRGVTIFRTCRQFFLRVMHFKQFFSLHLVMKTIFLQPFLKNVTGFL